MRWAILITCHVGLATLTSCNSGSPLSTIAGKVAIDGAPVESGTIHFEFNAPPRTSGGASVQAGDFEVRNSDGFEPGEYAVTLQAFRKTGKVIDDPQKGKVEITTAFTPKDSPQIIQVTRDNATDLSLNFKTKDE